MNKLRINYLNNNDLLHEIHKSKTTYCSFISEEDQHYDTIISNVDCITDEIIQGVLEKRNAQLRAEAKKQKRLSCRVLTIDDLVFRVMTDEHIPEGKDDKKQKCMFPPFKHYKFVNGELKEVGRSHWMGGFGNGYFSQDHGKVTNKLAFMFMKLVERYGQKSNWRGYTYNDEMKNQALLQLTQVGLQFNEARSDNPFAYYTRITQNAFTRILNLEKKVQKLRDDMLIAYGAMPSFTRQVDDAISQRDKDIVDNAH